MNRVELTEQMNRAKTNLTQLALDGTDLEQKLSGKLLLESLGTKQTGLDKLEKDVNRNDAMQTALSEHIIQLEAELEELNAIDTHQSKQAAIEAVSIRKNNAVILENIMTEQVVKQVASFMAVLSERLHEPDLGVSIAKICNEPENEGIYHEAFTAQKARLFDMKASEPTELLTKPAISSYDELREEREGKVKNIKPAQSHDYSNEPEYANEAERVEAMFMGGNESVKVRKA